MYLPLSSNAYDDVTDLKIYEFHKKHKISISWEQNIIFFSNTKNSSIADDGLLYNLLDFVYSSLNPFMYNAVKWPNIL